MSRRLVTVLFLDLVGWTELAERLDPEPLQVFLEQYYDICVAAVEQHGGIVEKFIGDAIMAVFGAEHSEEDDALRAIRTGFQCRKAISDLAVEGFTERQPQIHCGVAAGPALVTHSARAGIRIVGDVVNLAARLQSAAPAGDVLINDVAAQLVRAQVSVEAVDPLTLKGKREPVPAWRALELVSAPAQPDTASGSGMVNRHSELARLLDAARAVVRDRRAQVVTVLGAPGVGKSRLVREAVRRMRAEHPDIATAWGTCPSYGATWSYGPLAEVVACLRNDNTLPEPADSTQQRVLDVLSFVTQGPHNGAGTCADGTVRPGVEEILWATQQFVAGQAETRPLVVVWEDLQWAKPALLELIHSLASRLPDHPLLMVCLFRPDPGAPHLPQTATSLHIGPLSSGDTFDLVRSLAARLEPAEVTAHGMDLVERVVADCGGSPLFAELMIETVALGHAPGQLPPSVTALVGAMVDRLPTDARQILHAGSVIGTSFTLEQVAHLDVPATATAVTGLLDHQLIQRGDRPGEYRFTQQPVHEVAYSRLEKEQRLRWHRQLADHGVAPELHLEGAVRLMRDLRPTDPELVPLEQRAAEALVHEGTQALRQRDLPTAADLLSRAGDVSPAPPSELGALAAIRLSDALLLSGEQDRAAAVVAELARESAASRAGRACRTQQLLVAARTGAATAAQIDELAAELDRDRDDDLSWCRFHQIQMFVHVAAGRFRAAEEAVQASLARSHAMDDTYERDRMLVARCEIGQWSPTPIRDKIPVCRQLLTRLAADRFLLLPVLVALARYLALTDDLPGARDALQEARGVVDDLRLTMGSVLIEQVAGVVSSLAGDPAEAQRHFLRAAERLTATGERRVALAMQVLALRERVHQDDGPGEVDRDARALVDARSQMDMRAQALCLALAARTAARCGQSPVTAITEARRLLEDIDDPCLQGDAYAELAVAYRHLGDTVSFEAMMDAANASYSAVGATLPGTRLREWR